MNKGEKILQLRKKRGMTQKKLGEMVGVTESAIRNYELGIRSPDKREQSEGIADALGVDHETIGEQRDFTEKQAAHTMFLFEDAFGISPQKDGTHAGIAIPDGSPLHGAVQSWAQLRRKFDGGEIDEDTYRAMKDSFFSGTDGSPSEDR